MLLKSLLLITSLSIGPHSLDQWLRHWDLLPMPPINRNLTATSLDGKTLIIHDSQGIPSFIRAWQYMPLRAGTAGKTLSGYQVNARVFETLGYKNTSTASSGTTFTLLNIGDNWPVEADHDGVHWTNSQGVTFGTELANFTEFFSMAVKSSAFDSFDMSSPMIMRLGIFNTTNHTERLNLLEFRGATTGFAANYGNGGSGSFRGGDQDWDETDQLYIIHKGFKSAAAMGGGSSEVGVKIRKSGAAVNGKQANMLGGLLHIADDAGSGNPDMNSPVTGTMFGYIGHNGMSALDHINNVEDKTIDGLIQMFEGFDTVMIAMGHNQADEATYTTDMVNLAARYKARHTANGYDEPEIIGVAMWGWGDGDDKARMGAQSAALDSAYGALGYGVLNLYELYGGVSPEEHGLTPDGDAFSYVFDTNDLHPDSATTAQQIADDVWWNFEEENIWVDTGQPANLRARMRRNPGLFMEIR